MRNVQQEEEEEKKKCCQTIDNKNKRDFIWLKQMVRIMSLSSES